MIKINCKKKCLKVLLFEQLWFSTYFKSLKQGLFFRAFLEKKYFLYLLILNKLFLHLQTINLKKSQQKSNLKNE